MNHLLVGSRKEGSLETAAQGSLHMLTESWAAGPHTSVGGVVAEEMMRYWESAASEVIGKPPLLYTI